MLMDSQYMHLQNDLQAENICKWIMILFSIVKQQQLIVTIISVAVNSAL